MDGTIQAYVLDMAADTKKEPLRVKQYDTNSRQARITLKMGGEPWTIPFGAQIHINVRKTDGKLADATCTREDEHTVLAPITEQMTAVTGTQLGELYFLGSDGDIKSQTFPVVVYEAVMDQARIESSDDFQSLQDALRDVKASTDTAGIAAQYATEQGNSARDMAQRAENAVESIQAAVDAAAAAKACESNAKDSELAAARTQQAVTDYVEAQKAAFVGYSKRESDSQYANALTNSATGEGGATVEDAWTAPVLGLDVAGRSEQVQTTGKNLFDTDTYVAFMLSKNDAANTVNKKLFDGRECLYINGSIVSTKTVLFSCSPEQIYTISYDVYVVKTTGTASGNGFAFARENGANLNVLPKFTDVGKWTKITLTTTTDCLYVFPTYGSRCEQYIDIKSIQIEMGSTVTEYEPYTGGEPSPSPDYPQDIISTGTVSTGAQLFDADTIVQGMVNAETGELGSSSIAVSSDYIPVELGNYFLSGEGLRPYMNRVVFYTAEKTYISSDSVYAKNGLIIVPETAAYMRLRFVGTENLTPADIKALKPMLNTGSTPKPWEPYTGGKPSPSVEYPQTLEVQTTGKNLFGGDALVEKLKAEADATVDGANGTVTFSAPKIDKKVVFSDFVAGKEYTIILYGRNTNSTNRMCNISVEYADGARGNLMFDTMGSDSYCVYHTASKRDVASLTGAWGGQDTILYYEKCGIFEGNIAPEDFEPYRTATAPITLTEPLRGIGDYRDRIMCKDGVYGIERWIKEIVFDGTEEWTAVDIEGSNAYRYLIRLTPSAIGAYIGKATAMCSYLSLLVFAGTNIPKQGFTIGEPNFLVYLDGRPLADFKIWLAENSLELIYTLAAPTWTPLPDATQQALNALTTYAGTTHLTITAGGTTPTVTLDYVQDTHKAFEQHDVAVKQYVDNQLANIVAALPTATQAAIVDNQTTKLLQEV